MNLLFMVPYGMILIPLESYVYVLVGERCELILVLVNNH